MSVLNSAITCQAVPDVPKLADVDAQPEEPSADVMQGEMDLLNPWKLTPDSAWCLGWISESYKTSAFGLGAFFLPGSQRWCHFTRGLSRGACGNRKQETGHASAFPFMPAKNLPRSNFRCRHWCLPFDWISVSMREFLDIWRDCCVRYRRLMIAYRIHAKCRLYSKNCLSECLLPKADKAEAEGCQDPRQLFFSFPGKHVTYSCYFFVHCLIT